MSDNENQVDVIKRTVKEYIKIDDNIKDMNTVLKDLRKKKSEYEDTIMNYMLSEKLGKVDIGSGMLRISKSKPKKPVNKKIVLDVLVEHLNGGHDVANKITEEIFNNDEAEEVTKLERKSNKKN